jgi:hypothetical protein
MVEYANAETLGLGDTYRLAEHGETYGPVWDVGYNQDAHTFVHTSAGLHELWDTHRVYVQSRAPRCPCGRRFERCEAGCPWPQELLDAFFCRV